MAIYQTYKGQSGFLDNFFQTIKNIFTGQTPLPTPQPQPTKITDVAVEMGKKLLEKQSQPTVSNVSQTIPQNITSPYREKNLFIKTSYPLPLPEKEENPFITNYITVKNEIQSGFKSLNERVLNLENNLNKIKQTLQNNLFITEYEPIKNEIQSGFKSLNERVSNLEENLNKTKQTLSDMGRGLTMTINDIKNILNKNNIR